MEKTKLLILCTANSARSQMGEGLMRSLAGDRFEVFSAGTKATKVNPFAIRAMTDIGIDISDQYSKSLEIYLEDEFEYVITVCDQAAENCPVFPAPVNRIHWGFPDPAFVEGTDEEILASFIEVRNMIKMKFVSWLGVI